MKKKDIEKIFPDITDEQFKELVRLESEAFERGKTESNEEHTKAETEKLIDAGIKESGAKNLRAVKALLELDRISMDSGELKGLSEQLEALKKDCDYLFDSGSKKPQFTAPEKSSKDLTKKSFEALSYRKRLKLFLENPALYRQLTER